MDKAMASAKHEGSYLKPLKTLHEINVTKKMDSCQICNSVDHEILELQLRTTFIRLCPDFFNKMVQKVNDLSK